MTKEVFGDYFCVTHEFSLELIFVISYLQFLCFLCCCKECF